MSADKGILRKALIQSLAIFYIAVAVALCFNTFRRDKLPLVQDWSPSARLEISPGNTLEMPFRDAQTHFKNKSATFIDARSPEEYSAGHIQGAMSLFWDEFDSKYPQAMDGIGKNDVIIVYCDGEACELSRYLAQALRDEGYQNVKVLVNGWSVWKNSGLPTE